MSDDNKEGAAEPVNEHGFVQPVPDHCDRITWRGHYYHLREATPPAVMPAAPSDAVWLIEDQDHFPRHRWLRIVEETKRAYLSWTEDANVAVRFCRRADAVGFQKLHVDFCALSIVTGHTFMDMPAALSQTQEEPAAGEQAGAVDRGDAVNLARNMLAVRDCESITSYGVRVLCEAVMTMDAALAAIAAPDAAIAAREQEDTQ